MKRTFNILVLLIVVLWAPGLYAGDLAVDGKVGIGTYYPTESLEITSGNIKLDTGNLKVLGGRVGIGTSSPSAGIHVTNGVDLGGVYRQTAIFGNSAYDWTSFGSAQGGRIRGSSEGYLVLESYPTGTDNRLYLNYSSSGNVIIANGGGMVGVGTSSPSKKLDVIGDASVSGAMTVGSGGNVLKTSCSLASNVCTGASNCMVTCPAGTVMTGGGGICTTPMYTNWPIKENKWYVSCEQGTGQSTKAYAICCQY